jgi:hypothetical protein
MQRHARHAIAQKLALCLLITFLQEALPVYEATKYWCILKHLQEGSRKQSLASQLKLSLKELTRNGGDSSGFQDTVPVSFHIGRGTLLISKAGQLIYSIYSLR